MSRKNSTHSSPSNHVPHPRSGAGSNIAKGRKARLHTGTPNDYMLGEVRGHHFHVHDVVDQGKSHRALTGESPTYRPIHLDKIARAGHRIEYLR